MIIANLFNRNKFKVFIALCVAAVMLLITLITVPAVNHFFYQLNRVYCNSENTWVRTIIINLVRIEVENYPTGGICALTDEGGIGGTG